MLNAGKYRAKAVFAQLGQAGTGNYQVGIEFDLLDHPGQKATWYGTFSDAAREYTFRSMRTAGFKGADLSDLSSLSAADTPEVTLVVEHEEWEGKIRAKVKFINSNGGLAMKNTLNDQSAKAFAAKMKGALLMFDKQSGTAPVPSAPVNGAPPVDDIPF